MAIIYRQIGTNIVELEEIESIDKKPAYVKLNEHKATEFVSNIEHDISVLEDEIAERQARVDALREKLAKVNADLAKQELEAEEVEK